MASNPNVNPPSSPNNPRRKNNKKKDNYVDKNRRELLKGLLAGAVLVGIGALGEYLTGRSEKDEYINVNNNQITYISIGEKTIVVTNINYYTNGTTAIPPSTTSSSSTITQTVSSNTNTTSTNSTTTTYTTTTTSSQSQPYIYQQVLNNKSLDALLGKIPYVTSPDGWRIYRIPINSQNLQTLANIEYVQNTPNGQSSPQSGTFWVFKENYNNFDTTIGFQINSNPKNYPLLLQLLNPKNQYNILQTFQQYNLNNLYILLGISNLDGQVFSFSPSNNQEGNAPDILFFADPTSRENIQVGLAAAPSQPVSLDQLLKPNIMKNSLAWVVDRGKETTKNDFASINFGQYTDQIIEGLQSGKYVGVYGWDNVLNETVVFFMPSDIYEQYVKPLVEASDQIIVKIAENYGADKNQVKYDPDNPFAEGIGPLAIMYVDNQNIIPGTVQLNSNNGNLTANAVFINNPQNALLYFLLVLKNGQIKLENGNTINTQLGILAAQTNGETVNYDTYKPVDQLIDALDSYSNF